MLIRAFKRALALAMTAALALSLFHISLAETMTVYTARDDAAVYDSSGKEIGALPANVALTLTGVKGSVCRVERDGRTAYMLKADLSRDPAAGEAAPAAQRGVKAYASREGATVYDSKGNAAGTLALNSEVTVTAVKGKICKVTSGSLSGYMKKADLAAAPVSASAAQTKSVTGYVCKGGAKLVDARGNTLVTLSLNTAVTVTAAKRGVCRVTSGAHTGYMRASDLSPARVETGESGPAAGAAQAESNVGRRVTGTAKEMDWWTSDIQTIFDRGVVARITDVETGLSWEEKRTGGTNHADCQPLTASDTAAMKQAYGGTWSWNRRAVFVTIDGVNYAASINGMPHGGGSISDNDFNGHHCIHFTNSRTHGSNKVCPLHQAAIKRAAAAHLQ